MHLAAISEIQGKRNREGASVAAAVITVRSSSSWRISSGRNSNQGLHPSPWENSAWE